MEQKVTVTLNSGESRTYTFGYKDPLELAKGKISEALKQYEELSGEQVNFIGIKMIDVSAHNGIKRHFKMAVDITSAPPIAREW